MSEFKVNKISPASGTDVTLGDSGDTFTIPSGATITNSGTQNGFGSTSASDLTSGTLPDARFPATLPAASGVNLTALNATNLGSGTVPDARFPATLPAASGVNLTALNATQLTSGTLPMARLSGTLPALNGSALTNLPASALTPQFYVYDSSADITLTSGTATKVTTFTSEHFDADGVFDQTNQRFTVPSGQAGKYFLSARVPLYAPSNTGTDFRVFLYKNGSLYHSGYLMSFGSNSVMRHLAPHVTMLEDASVGDYYEVYCLLTVGSGAAPKILADGNNPKFMNFFGFKIG